MIYCKDNLKLEAMPHIILRMIKFKSRVGVFVSFAVSLLFLTGCFTSSGDVQFRYKPEKIIKKVEMLSRSGKIYRDLDTILIGDILWYSADLKMEYLNEMKESGRVDSDGVAKKSKVIAESDKKELDFLAAIYTSEKKWDDFDQSKSIWKLRFVGKDGVLVAPTMISKVEHEDIPDSHLFSFISPWKSVYRIKIPRNKSVAGLDVYKLKLYSILGDTKFSWTPDDDEKAKPPVVIKAKPAIQKPVKTEKPAKKEKGLFDFF